MARIGIENIDEIEVIVEEGVEERGVDTEGPLALDQEVAAKYLEMGYDKAPRDKDEMKAQGADSFNGLMSSAKIEFETEMGSSAIIGLDENYSGTRVVIHAAPTRWLVGQAFRDIVKERKEMGEPLTEEQIQRMSPDMLNVSLVAPVKFEGRNYLLSQVKGAALGGGEIHAGLVAQNVRGKHLLGYNPLITTLQTGAMEEIGLDTSTIDYSSFVYMVDERETGQVNFAAVARGVDADYVLGRFEEYGKEAIEDALAKQKEAKPEVMGLAMMSVGGLALIPTDSDAQSGLKIENIEWFYPTLSGLVRVSDSRDVRPYTAATVDYLSKQKNVEFLLEKAGI